MRSSKRTMFSFCPWFFSFSVLLTTTSPHCQNFGNNILQFNDLIRTVHTALQSSCYQLVPQLWRNWRSPRASIQIITIQLCEVGIPAFPLLPSSASTPLSRLLIRFSHVFLVIVISIFLSLLLPLSYSNILLSPHLSSLVCLHLS